MKKLLIKLFLVAGICLAAFAGLFALATFGSVDAFYHKFTYPAKSLIIGNSRAAQAILPQELEPLMQSKSFEGPLLNYAFTVTHSPFGPAYLQSIKRKLPPETKNGLFIIAVDPWSLTVSKAINSDTPESLPEQKSFIGKLTDVNHSPNLTYLKEFYQQPFYRLIADNLFPIEKPHKDGWLELNVPMSPAVAERRRAVKLQDYIKKASEEKLSETRLKSLAATVAFLKRHGKVVLVRIPVSAEMLEIENTFTPALDQLISEIAAKHESPYLNYSGLGNNYITIDGNHLHKDAGRLFTQKLALDIGRLN